MEQQLFGIDLILFEFYAYVFEGVTVLRAYSFHVLTVIDMMVDPDGTLDALSNLGLTSPLTDPNLNIGTPQGLPGLHPGAGASPSGPLPPSRPVVLPTTPGGPSGQTEGAK